MKTGLDRGVTVHHQRLRVLEVSKVVGTSEILVEEVTKADEAAWAKAHHQL